MEDVSLAKQPPSMVTISDRLSSNHLSVFPPINHEGLYISSSPDSSQPFPESFHSTKELDARFPFSLYRWLRRKILNSTSAFRFITSMTSLCVALLVFKWVRRRRNRQFKIKMLIRKQDEKIVKLLEQIALLNQLLLHHHHHRIPH